MTSPMQRAFLEKWTSNGWELVEGDAYHVCVRIPARFTGHAYMRCCVCGDVEQQDCEGDRPYDGEWVRTPRFDVAIPEPAPGPTLDERFAALPEDLQNWLVVNPDALQGTRYAVCTYGGHGTPTDLLYLYYLTGPREWTELARVKTRLEAAEAMARHRAGMEERDATR